MEDIIQVNCPLVKDGIDFIILSNYRDLICPAECSIGACPHKVRLTAPPPSSCLHDRWVMNGLNAQSLMRANLWVSFSLSPPFALFFGSSVLLDSSHGP